MTGHSLLSLLAEPLSYTFMIKAMFGGAAVGALCGLLSCFVTLKGWSLLGDALSHSVVPGVAVAALFGGPLALGAFVAGLLAVLGIGVIERNSALKNDAVIGVVFTAFFAAGLFIISVFPANIRIQTILFGNLLGISSADLLQVAVIGVICIIAFAAKWKDLLIYCFDPSHARAIGLNVTALHLMLLILLSLAAVAALQAVGALLVVAMLITPGATAQLWTQKFSRMLFIAPALAALACMGGAYASYFLDGSTGGAIVVLQTAIFILALFFAPGKGILATRRRRGALKRETTQ
ncbi:metal ABC transporter permease [Candidatus Pantoea soli]|uniref:Metal ABC transporter permease n=1 Tax=Candidatus Pantoea soli TaxID=3098669 RepID=A0A518XJI8_9GAMM|nr:metal ABC transporter permease [Pantoea soli]QDY44350.1 metal ABC transporter permease [Pantoea soli]